MNKKNAFFSLLILGALGLPFVSCKKDDNPVTATPTSRFTATINGAGEKPTSTTSAATGTFVGVIDETTRTLSYTVTYTGPFTSSLTAGHLHRVTPNATNGVGPVEIPFTSLTSPIVGTFQLANQNRVDSMKNGFYYANLHTTIYPAGEIRGDIKKQ
jgi:hypothetical protein